VSVLFDKNDAEESRPPKKSAEPEQIPVLTVSAVSLLIKEVMEGAFHHVWVSGEISNLRQPRSGHFYFDLKDESAVLHAVMWRSAAARLRFDLREGQQVVCQGGIDVYPPQGKYQLVVQHVEPVGEGALQLAFRQLHDRLKAEGLFDAARKRRLPAFPKRIAVITSPTGAAVRDFLNIARRRWPSAKILLLPVRVQGDMAAGEIAAALARANQLSPTPEVIVVTRGGGSLEDLWCFNEEIVVRAIHASRVPVVSGVGHEVDVTLADLVADVRAPTPSAAAEIVLPDEGTVRDRLHQLESRLGGLLRARAAQARQRLESLERHRVFRCPFDWLRDHAQRLDELEERGTLAIERQLRDARTKLASMAGHLESLSPLAVLARGYSLTTRVDDGRVVRDAATLAAGDLIRTRLASGEVVSRVEQANSWAENERTEY
jgi:exodeoxyribonuclease VII large subunit